MSSAIALMTESSWATLLVWIVTLAVMVWAAIENRLLRRRLEQIVSSLERRFQRKKSNMKS